MAFVIEYDDGSFESALGKGNSSGFLEAKLFETEQEAKEWAYDLIGVSYIGDESEYSIKKQKSTHNVVNNPKHYHSSKAFCPNCGHVIKCIDIVQHYNFNLGNATKYIWRCDLKNDAIEDLEKAIQYLQFEISKRKKEQNVK